MRVQREHTLQRERGCRERVGGQIDSGMGRSWVEGMGTYDHDGHGHGHGQVDKGHGHGHVMREYKGLV